MICNEIMELAPLYWTNELDAARLAAFREHILVCAECKEAMDEQHALDSSLRETVLAEPVNTHNLEARVLHAIAEPPAPIRMRGPLWRVASIAAAAVLLLTTFFVYRTISNSRVAKVYADAADDHRDEVIQQQPRKWLTDQERIAALAERHGVSIATLSSMAPAGYHLDRARVCRLNGRSYLHVVYSGTKGAQEYSAFLRKRDGESLPGSVHEKSNGKEIHVATRGADHVAGVQSADLTAFIVTDLPGDAALHEAEFVASVF
jgi:hypothetical protein